MADQGLENIFNLDLNNDGLIGDQPPDEPDPVNDGTATFAIEGIPQLGQVLSISLTNSDPDGDGTPTVAWLASNQDGSWSQVGSDPEITVSADLEGRQLLANVSYIDGEGFSEDISTEPVLIPITNADDYGTTPESSGFLALGSRLEGDLEVAGDLDWFKVELEAGRNYIFDQIGTGLADPLLTLRDELGSILTSDDDSGGDLNSQITFAPEKSGHYYLEAGSYRNEFTGKYFIGAYEDVTQPEEPINDGAATFAIEGTPQLGQVLSISLTNSDPDGDGTPTVAWLASNQDGTWSQVGSDPEITISADLEGRQLLANVSYIDGEGFSEDVSTEPVLIPVSNADDYGASPESSGSLSIGTSIEGNLESLGDLDWFKVELDADKYYNFELTGITLADSFLSLKEANGNIIFSDDDGGDGFSSRIIFSPESSGTYYLEASAYNNEYTGTYSIAADEADALPSGYNPEDGFGHVDAKRSFEKLLGITLDDAADLGGDLWGLDNIGAPEVWTGSNGFSGATGSGTVIAVIDTGVDLDHPEFQNRIAQGFDFVDYDNIADDGEGHGTHVAGTIAGADDGEGITGVAPDASIMPIRVLDDEGYGYISDIIAGIRWAADNDADVINLSLGGGGYSQAMADAVAYASDLGSVVVMAAGNDGGRSPIYPAAHAETHGIAVGAVDQDKSLASFSNRAGLTFLDYVTAPGVGIFSSTPNGNYDYYSGTSMASPHVAGIAALLKSHDESLTPESIENLITSTAFNNIKSELSDTEIDELTGVPVGQIITLETLDKFDEDQLQTRLIGSLSGGLKARKSVIRELKANEQEGLIIEDIDVIKSTNKSFITLDLLGSNPSDYSDLLEDLLSKNHFNYFEIDSQMRMI